MDRANSPVNSILEQAARIVRRSKETTGTIEQAESYKRRQIEELKQFATTNQLWVDLSILEITYMNRRGEKQLVLKEQHLDTLNCKNINANMI